MYSEGAAQLENQYIKSDCQRNHVKRAMPKKKLKNSTDEKNNVWEQQCSLKHCQ
jgi:hypothetical protein